MRCGTDEQRCYGNPLIFSDGEGRCYFHTSDDQRKQVQNVDQRARKIVPLLPKAVRDETPKWSHLDWPYGPNIDVRAREAMCDWAESLGLKMSKRDDYGSFLGIPQPEYEWPEEVPDGFRILDHRLREVWWMDHVSAWTRSGKPAVVIGHPYVDPQTFPRRFEELCRDADAIGLQVLHTPGWYGYGTPGIEVWAPSQLAAVDHPVLHGVDEGR